MKNFSVIKKNIKADASENNKQKTCFNKNEHENAIFMTHHHLCIKHYQRPPHAMPRTRKSRKEKDKKSHVILIIRPRVCFFVVVHA